MFSQPVTVTSTDGTVREVTLTQWSIGQFAMYAQSRGWKIDPASPGLLAITMLRFQAYAELHRAPDKARPPFERWDQDISDVSPVEGATSDVDPTRQAPSGG